MSRRVVLALAVLMAFAFSGVGSVPFHPDESSLLFQSQDLERYLSDPRSMAWTEANRTDPEQQYRALNAPFSKYVLGFGRALGGNGPASVGVDWDWSKSWAANQAAGALPKPGVLLPARLASTAMVAAALLVITLVGRRLGGTATGLAAAVLLGLNALVLLHGRRAMAEGTLTFTVSLALWGILLGDRKPWLAGLTTALAFSTKHSALALLPMGVLAVLWRADAPTQSGRWDRPAVRIGVFVLIATAVVMALNPLLWADPLRSGLEILQARRELVAEQIRAQAEHSALQLPMSAVDSLSALIAQVYLTPAQFEELPNYAEQLGPSIVAYQRMVATGLLRGWLAGALLMGLTLAGQLFGLSRLRLAEAAERRCIGLLALTTVAQTIVLLLTIPFPYQRYYMPLIPLYTLWASYAVVQIVALIKRLPIRRAA